MSSNSWVPMGLCHGVMEEPNHLRRSLFAMSQVWHVAADAVMLPRIRRWREELAAGSSKAARLVRAYGTDAEICLDKAGVSAFRRQRPLRDAQILGEGWSFEESARVRMCKAACSSRSRLRQPTSV